MLKYFNEYKAIYMFYITIANIDKFLPYTRDNYKYYQNSKTTSQGNKPNFNFTNEKTNVWKGEVTSLISQRQLNELEFFLHTNQNEKKTF